MTNQMVTWPSCIVQLQHEWSSDGPDDRTIICRYVLSGLLCIVQLDDMQSWAVVTRLLTHKDKNFLAVYLQILNWLQSQSLFISRWLQTLVTALVLSRLQGRSRRSGRSGHGRTTFSAGLIISLLFDSLYSTQIIVQNTLQTVCSDSQLRSVFKQCWIMETFRNHVCLPNFISVTPRAAP